MGTLSVASLNLGSLKSDFSTACSVGLVPKALKLLKNPRSSE